MKHLSSMVFAVIFLLSLFSSASAQESDNCASTDTAPPIDLAVNKAIWRMVANLERGLMQGLLSAEELENLDEEDVLAIQL